MTNPEFKKLTYSTPSKLEALHLLKCHPGIFTPLVLNKGISLAATRHRIPVQVNKLKFAKRFKDLSDIGFGKVEMQRTDV
jgi:hypothetical protein